MKLKFEKSFKKDLEKIEDKGALKKVKETIEMLEKVDSISEFHGDLKRLKGDKRYWRIRIGEYRIGLEIDRNTVIFVRILHRRDIYRYFP